MSRALNLAADQAHVLQTCQKHDIAISDMETLASGGTRVVLLNGNAAAIIAKAYSGKIIKGAVRRMPSRLMHN